MFLKVWANGYWLGQPYTKDKRPIETMDELVRYIDENEFIRLKLLLVQDERWLVVRIHAIEAWEEIGFADVIKAQPETEIGGDKVGG